MITEVTKEMLKEWNACNPGYEYWLKADKPNIFDFCEHALADGYFDYANWLIVRCMDRPQYLAYAINAAELALPINEAKYPENDAPRKAIEAAKVALADDTEANREAARVAALAARASCNVSRGVPRDAAYYAAYHAAHGAYEAARAAYHASCDAPYCAAQDAASADESLGRDIINYGMELMRKEAK